MNIKEAKEQIEQTAAVYLTKDEYGNYLIPVEKQRPVFMSWTISVPLQARC